MKNEERKSYIPYGATGGNDTDEAIKCTPALGVQVSYQFAGLVRVAAEYRGDPARFLVGGLRGVGVKIV